MREARRPGASVYPIRMRHILNRAATIALSGGIAIQRFWTALPLLKAGLARHWTAERKVLVAYIVAMAIVGVEAVVVYRAVALSTAGTQAALLISKVIGLNKTMTDEVDDAVIAQRDFLLLGSERALRLYTARVNAFEQTTGELRDLVLADPEQLGRLQEVKRLFAKWRTDGAEPEIAARLLAPDHLFEVVSAAHAIALRLRGDADAIVGNTSPRTAQWHDSLDALKAQIRIGLSLERSPAAIAVWKMELDLTNALVIPTVATRPQVDRIEELLRAQETAAALARTNAVRVFASRRGSEIDDLRRATSASIEDEEGDLQRLFGQVESALAWARFTTFAGSVLLVGLLFVAMIEFRVVSWQVNSQSHEMSLLNQLGELLHACGSFDEAWAVIGRFARWLFPEEAGMIYLISPSRDLAESVISWGTSSFGKTTFTPDQCWAIRRGQVHLVENTQAGIACQHLADPLPRSYACLPLVAQNEMLGVLLLLMEPAGDRAAPPLGSRIPLARTFAEQIGSAVSNLRLRETLRHQSIRDPLTGLFNRRYLEETIDRELRRAGRHKGHVGVIMFDIDHFKQFNDSFGHDAGDALLRALGKMLQESVRKEDIACRYGGEEFVLTLPDASPKDTMERAEELQQAASHLGVVHRGRPLGHVTLSLGVATYPENGVSTEGLLRAADTALYRAKKNGRARIEVA